MFLAVDPQNQFSNPYLAFGNNPVLMADPNGEFAFVPLLVAAAIGAGIGGAGYVTSVAFSEGGFQNWDAGQFWQSIGIGAISGVAGYGIGAAFGAVGSQGVIGELGRAAFHGVSNQIIGAGFGIDQNFASFASGALGSLAGSALHNNNALAKIGGSSLVGGVGAEISGGDFWRGAATGATIGIVNHGAHGLVNRKNVNNKVKAAREFLEDSGYSIDMVAKDVVGQQDSFFGKYYAKFTGDIKDYGDFFTGNQSDSYSQTKDAFLSKSRTSIIGSRRDGAVMTLALKYYPSRANSIGLVQTGLNHLVEGAMELIDGSIRYFTGIDNSFYDLHNYNSNYYLKYRSTFK